MNLFQTKATQTLNYVTVLGIIIWYVIIFMLSTAYRMMNDLSFLLRWCIDFELL